MREQLLSVGIDIGTFSQTGTACLGRPDRVDFLGRNKFRLREISAVLRFYALVRAPQCGAPEVEAPE